MKKISLILLSLCLTVLVSAQKQAEITDSTVFKLNCDGVERTYTMHIPTGIKANAPLVVSLHGYGSRTIHRKDLNAAADKYGFAICYPLGYADSRGKLGWNVGYPSQKSSKINDAKFVYELSQHVSKQFNLSSKNTFCTGMSNGGDMCYQMAYTMPDAFAAYASIAGLTMMWVYQNHDVQKPVPFMEVHGTEDLTSKWEGDLTGKGGWGEYMPVPLAVSYMVAKNRCTEEIIELKAGKNPENKRSIIEHRYVNGIDGNEVWLFEIVGGTHSWADKDINTGEEIWRFFSKYVK